MVRLVDQLEARGLLRRVTHAADRRTTVPTLTDAGRELLARATPLVTASDERFAAALDGDERVQLLSLLRRLNAASDGAEAVSSV
jgi:DNA-binding MarR family transcriptional regulator